MEYLNAINFVFVLFFGVTLTLAFADIPLQKNIKGYTMIFFSLGIIQLLAYFLLGEEFLYNPIPS